MAQNYDNAHLEWIRLAEEAIKKRDYEAAARFLRHVTVYFGLINDVSNQRRFAIKTGKCYLQAAKKLEGGNDPLRAISLHIKASNSFQEGGSEDLAKVCNSGIRKLYASITRGGFIEFHGDAHDLKGVGDYFVKKGDFERAVECYQTAAEKAWKGGKLALSGGLYSDAGDCYRRMKNFEGAAKSYSTAADMYLKDQKHFEAARHYCDSGFLFIRAGRLEEASIMARRASLACKEGRIDVLLKDLSYICRSISEGALYEAEERWKRVRMKYKRSYINLIDSCFQALRQKLG